MKPLSHLAHFAVIALAVLTGCAKVPRQAGFDDVQKSIADRTGQPVHWRGVTTEDAQADAAVATLLARELTADEAVQIALLNNLNLQATYEDLGISQAELVQAGVLKNPVLSAEIRFPDDPEYPLEIDVFQDFMSIFLLRLRKKVAAAEFEAAKLRVANEVMELMVKTRGAFYTLQGAQQMAEMRRTILEAAQASADASQRLREAGNITELQLHSDQTLAAQAQLDLIEAETEVAEARQHLSALMGVARHDDTWQIADRLPDPASAMPSQHDMEARAIAQRLDLASARQEVEVATAQLGLTRRSRLFPEIDVGAHYEREPEGDATAGPSVDIPIPIFDQGQAATARGQAILRQSQRKYAAMELEVLTEVRAALARVQGAQKRADRYRAEMLPLRTRIVEETQLQYNAMQLGVFHLLEAKQAQIDAGREYVESLRDYWIARSELEKALGGSLPRQPATQPTIQPAPAESSEPHPHHHHHGDHP